MNSQEIQLQLLEQQHYKKILVLNRQRLLLNSQKQVSQSSCILQPVYKPELLYGQSSKFQKAERTRYIPKQIDSKIADKSMQAIIQTWLYQDKYSQEDAYLRKASTSRQVSFQNELTPSGRLEIDEILEEVRLSSKAKRVKSFKERYGPVSIEEKLSDIYSHISKLKLDQ